MPRRPDRPTFLDSDRLLARAVAQPVARFLAIEASGGVVLVLATVAALVWANSPWRAGYEAVWTTDLTIELGRWRVHHDLRHWVNDGLMAVFFFVVGVEVKAELVTGRLARREDAAFPVAAAVGGMAVPALLYLALNVGGDGADGWGIPMATDIAFAVGVMALAGARVPSALKVALLGIAVVDDIGAIAVIAAFYTDDLAVGWGLAAVAGLVGVVVLRRAGVWYLPIYALLGGWVWLATSESGVHATLAGVVLGLLVPVRPIMADLDAEAIAGRLSEDRDITAAEVRQASWEIRESVPMSERVLELLHPWSSYVIVPLFALANAGLELSGSAVADAVTSPVSAGVALGLVVGKPLGILGVAWLAVRLGIARRPEGVTDRELLGLGAVAGIGFTVSLFITGLAFDAPAVLSEAKLAILVASVVASAIGLALLRGGYGRGRVP
jgi:NhaA family Na+:H+ antiporter